MTPQEIAKVAIEEKGAMQKPTELPFLLERARGAKVVVEIGVAKGGTLWALAQVADPEATIIGIGLAGQVFSIGRYDETEVESLQKIGTEKQTVHFIQRDSHTPEAVHELKQILGDRKVDVLFIDADHTWLGVQTDFETYSPLVTSGGIVGFHDVGDYPFHEGNFAEVHKVWQELKQIYNTEEYVDAASGDWGGIGVLHYGDKWIFDKHPPTPPLVSIIIPVFNRADLTRACLDSIDRYTKNYELIVVQEGEDAEVTELLESHPYIYTQNKKPKGYAGALNTGLKLATGDYYVFMNNDVVVVPGWLEEIMKVFKDKRVGLVAPTLPDIGILQCVDNNRGQMIEPVDDPTALKGVCFAVSKECMGKVGVWDESYGLGGGEDNDLCIRVKQAGYQLVIARRAFIYHYGSAAFREAFKNDKDYAKKFAVGQHQKLVKKYGIQKKPYIMIAIPSFSGNVNHSLAIRLIEWTHDPDIRVVIKFYPHLAPLDNARNWAVKDFLEDFYTHLLFIDDDILPPPGALQALVAENKEIIAPLCFTWGHDAEGLPFPQPVAHRFDANHQYRPYVGKGVEETDIITGGMFLVKREVYEKLERPFYFTYHKNGLVIYSEDFVFSQQCQKLGYKLYTHYGLPCGHVRDVDIKQINDLLVKYEK